MMHQTDLRTRPKRPPTECFLCTSSELCWKGPIPANSGFVVQRRAKMDDGTKLFGQGDRFAAIHIVVSGCVRLFEIDADGVERLVALCLPGELIGMDGWAHGRHLYAAIVAGPTQVCQLNWPHTRDVAPTSALLQELLRKSVTQFDPSRQLWTHLPAVERVAVFLNRFVERAGSGCELPLTRREIGSLLGLAEETVVRAIAVLRAHRRLNLEGKQVVRIVARQREPGIPAR